LIALAKRCLAPEPADRPRDAIVVAEAVAALRADAERRAREAEVERARTEVKSAEERKRRRVQRALALAMVCLVTVAGVAAWWVDSVRAARRADQRTEELKRMAADQERHAEMRTRQLTTERDVIAALNEVQVLSQQGLNQADDPERWALTLVAARSALKRAEGLLASGESTDELRGRVAATAGELDRDDRDQMLLAELDRTSDSNEVRLFIPTSLTSVVSKRYANAFRTHGIDLTEVPTAEAVVWLKSQRFRERIALAIRGWTFSVSVVEQYPMNIYSASAHLA